MSIPLEQQIYSVLNPIFGVEVYPIVHPDPDGDKRPLADIFVVYNAGIGGRNFGTLEGTGEINRLRVQFSIYTNTFSSLKAKQRALIGAMKAANVLASEAVNNAQDHYEISGAIANVIVNPSIEDYDYNSKRFYSNTDFYCWSKE